MKKFTLLFVFVIVCRVFAWGNEGPNGAMTEINKWLIGKSFIRSTQTTCVVNDDCITYLTIFAKEAN